MLIIKTIKALYKNKIVRRVFTIICFWIGYILAKTFDINPFPEKKISLFGFFAIVVFIYVATDLFKIMKIERNKEK